eukprot:1469198-Prymnesium_polylepis.1
MRCPAPSARYVYSYELCSCELVEYKARAASCEYMGHNRRQLLGGVTYRTRDHKTKERTPRTGGDLIP